MKSVKILLSVLALGVVTAIPALRAADEKPAADAPKADAPKAERKGKGGRMNAEQMIERLDQAVGGLTADQKAKIKDIVTANMEKAKGAAPEDRGAIMQGQRDQIRAVLTADQQKKFDEMPQRGPGGGKKKKGGE
jgi:Spy/CpxP family protein refolding chaperone